MKKISFVIHCLMLTILLSCSGSSNIKINDLEGYWQIESVKEKGETFPLDDRSPLYDYYHLEKNTGFRKKVKPLFNGTFETSEDITAIKLIYKDEKTVLQFSTTWNTWTEEIISLTPSSLVLQHQGRTYHYKKASLLNLEDE